MGGDFVFDPRGNLTLRHFSTSSDDRPAVPTIMEAFRWASGGPTGK